MDKVSERFRRELRRELLEWEAEGVIPGDTAERLRERYSLAKDNTRVKSARYAEMMLWILCSLLIGGGVILLISHNWNMISPVLRLTMMFGMLFATLAFGAWVVITDRRSPGWCEPAAIAISAATAGSIAIISQIYHTTGGLDDFLLVWLLLLLPFVYIFRSFALSCIYIIGTLVFFEVHGTASMGAAYWLLFPAAILPLLCFFARPNSGAWARFFGRAMMFIQLVLIILLMDGFSSHAFDGTLLTFAFFAAITVGGLELARYEEKRVNLFLVCGGGFLLILTFASGFENQSLYRICTCVDKMAEIKSIQSLIGALLLIGAFALFVWRKFNPD